MRTLGAWFVGVLVWGALEGFARRFHQKIK